MNSLLENRANLFILLTAILISVGSICYTQDLEYSTQLVIGLCALTLLTGLLFFKLEWYYFLMIGLIPISISAGALGDAKLDFPSEGLLALLLPILLVFNTTYRKTIKKVFLHPLTLLLAVDLFIQLLTSLTGTHVDVSIKRILIRFFFIAGFFVTVNMLSNGKQLFKPWIFYALGLLPVMYFTFQKHFHHSFNPRVVFSISQPYYSDHTIYGACLAFIIPILLLIVIKRKQLGYSKRHQSIMLLVTLVVIAAQVFALSRASILSLVVAILFVILLHFKVRFKTILTGLVVVLIAAWTVKDNIYEFAQQNDAVSNDGELVNHFSSVTNVQSDASNLERINRWICAIRMFEERPLLGYGPGTYQFEYNQFQTLANKTYISTNMGDRGNAHSEYLTYLSETGIFGFIVFLCTVFCSIYYGMQNHEFLQDSILKILNLGVLLGLITFYFHGLFNSFIDQSKMGFLYFTALGTIVWINQKLKSESTSKKDVSV